ncbi:MAG: type II toxin-antitoxin system VapC family toxin [Alphaproteobacteria bacterium]|nr:type II toxin-antitoxin system VapC family toxin [Alphaproteobacteria bacterium]MDE2111666.1 type II toxin-antitoxin system VapC family toxin [Alphaproteobacteria bacterium]MDE2492822.1 type II toxin-antitoxin system VapC family toxin [Alphaproteobacteria bacterium]
MAVLVDSNVLLDLITEDPRWFSWSSQAIAAVAERARLVINAVIYAEVSIRFSRVEDVEAVLSKDIFDREVLSYEAAFLAGKAFTRYRHRGGGRSFTLPDFFIGAHAAVVGHELLTRDAARYRTYFPKLTLIAPD